MKNIWQWGDSIRAAEKVYWEQKRRLTKLSVNGPAYPQAVVDLEAAHTALFQEIHGYRKNDPILGEELWIIRRHRYWVTPISIECIEKVVEF